MSAINCLKIWLQKNYRKTIPEKGKDKHKDREIVGWMIRKKKKKRNPAYIHNPLVLDKSEWVYSDEEYLNKRNYI